MSKTCTYQDCTRNCYGTLCYIHKPRKPIKQRGKQTLKYEKWRDTVAKPYLDRIQGRVCVVAGCHEFQALDVDHIHERGSRADLKYELTNVRYLCRIHHRMVTDGKLKI